MRRERTGLLRGDVRSGYRRWRRIWCCWVSAILFGLPFYWLVITSLKPDAQVFQMPPVWFPHPLQWRNYPNALVYIPFFRYTLNTFTLCVLNVLGTVLSCSLVAYSLAKIRWKGRDLVFYSLLATMILPGQVTMIPTFAIFKWLGWIGSYKPLVIPAFFGSAFNIFLLRQFFLTIPGELSDAARIDGCTEFGTYARVILPLARPALATVALFTFIGTWNDFLGPLLYLTDERSYTLSLGIAAFRQPARRGMGNADGRLGRHDATDHSWSSSSRSVPSFRASR